MLTTFAKSFPDEPPMAGRIQLSKWKLVTGLERNKGSDLAVRIVSKSDDPIGDSIKHTNVTKTK